MEKPKKKNISIYINPDVYKEFKKYCIYKDMILNEGIEIALREYMEQEKADKYMERKKICIEINNKLKELLNVGKV